MKKIICAIMCVLFALSAVSCGSTEKGSADTVKKDENKVTNADVGTESSEEKNASEENTADVTEKTSDAKKVLVVYYSATGSTKSVAEAIAEKTGGDIFEIIPEKPYTDVDLDWTDDNSRVSLEHGDESKRTVPLASAVPENWDLYETVYIGYPIWWGIAAWPVNGFITANDFSGKTVIPFCTSASSGLGDSARLLKETANGGEWKDGKRFSSRGVSEEDLTSWLEELSK